MTASASITVIYGVQGCGKTMHAKAFARHYGRIHIVDDWPDNPKQVGPNTLVLTSQYSAAIQRKLPDSRWIPYDEALAAIQPAEALAP